MMTSNTSDLITKKDLHKMFWRSLPMEFSWHYERQMHMGFEFMMIPALRKIYDNDPRVSPSYTLIILLFLFFFNILFNVLKFYSALRYRLNLFMYKQKKNRQAHRH